MLQIREMCDGDEEVVLPLVHEFYHSDAVDHTVDDSVLRRTFADAVREHSLLRGVMLLHGQTPVGFAYITSFYACETGGVTVMIEEVYLSEACRGKGYGTQFFEWLFKEYPDAKRFRLEVTKSNEGAVRLYEKLGFTFMKYDQMIKDR